MINEQIRHIVTEFKPQTWHVAQRSGDHTDTLAAFYSRTVATEVRDELNADVAGYGFTPSNDEYAFICLCDCENRECKFL